MILQPTSGLEDNFSDVMRTTPVLAFEDNGRMQSLCMYFYDSSLSTDHLKVTRDMIVLQQLEYR